MRNFPAALLLFGSALLANRCAREVQIDLPEEPPRIVAVCHFTANQPFRVEVTISRPLYASGKPERPNDVDITLSSGGLFLDKLKRAYSEQGELYWESRDTAVAEKSYTLVARVAGLDAIESTSSIPAHKGLLPILIDPHSISTIPLQNDTFALRIPLTLELENLPANNRFFAFSLQHEIQTEDESVQSATRFLVDGRTFSLLNNTPENVVLINENFWSDNRRTLFLDAIIPFNPDTDKPLRLFVEWRTLSEPFYRYHLSLARQGDNLPLSDPDAVYNNVEGGYGNFSGYSVQVDTLELPN